MAPKRKRTAEIVSETSEIISAVIPVPPSKPVRSPSSRQGKDDIEQSTPKRETAAPVIASVRRSARLTRTVVSQNLTDEDEEPVEASNDEHSEHDQEKSEDSDSKPRSKRRRKSERKVNKIASVDEEGADNADVQAKTPRKRKPKITEPVVYDIPEVERKETTFKGGLHLFLPSLLDADSPGAHRTSGLRLPQHNPQEPKT